MILPHNYGQADVANKSCFRAYLSQLFRTSPSSIDRIIAKDQAANGIWESLKGLTGVTAKCNPSNNTGDHPIKMGGVVLMVAAHCPIAGVWISGCDFESYNSDKAFPLLSTTENCNKELELWNHLHAFFAATVPRKNHPSESSLRAVFLADTSVRIQMNTECFDPQIFSKALKDKHNGDACIGFRTLKELLDGRTSKSSLTWNPKNNEFIFEGRMQ